MKIFVVFVLVLSLFSGVIFAADDEISKFKRGLIENLTDKAYDKVYLYSETQKKWMWNGFPKALYTYEEMASCGTKTFRGSETNPSTSSVDNVLNLLIPAGDYIIEAHVRGTDIVELYSFTVPHDRKKIFTVNIE